MIPCVQDEACTPAAGRRGKIDCTSGSRVCKDIGPTQEVCGNNIDDDGDGVVDDGCVVRVPVPRTMAGNGTGSYIVGTTCYQSGNGTGTVGTNFNAKNYCKGRGYSDTNGKWQCGRDGYVDWVECVR